MTRKIMLITLLATLALTAPPAVPAEQQTPISVEELLDSPSPARFDPGDFSPDGVLFAYTIVDPVRQRAMGRPPDWQKTGVSWYGVGGDIWISDLRTGEARNITGGVGNNWGPKWSPDGTRLAFLSDRDGGDGFGPGRLWIWERSSNELRRVGEVEIQPTLRLIEWSADGRSLVVSVLPRDVTRAEYAAAYEGAAAPDPESGVTARVYSFDPNDPEAGPQTEQINLDIVRRGLAQVDAATGALRWIVPDARVPVHVPSPDRTQVAWAVLLGTEAPGSSQFILDIVVHDLKNGDTRTVASRVRAEPWEWNLTWSPASDALAYRTVGPTASDEVFVASSSGGEPTRVAEGPPPGEYGGRPDIPSWGPAGRYVYFTRESVVWRAAVDGSGAAEFAASDGRQVKLIAGADGRLWTVDGGRSAVVQTLHETTKQAGFGRLDLGAGTITPVIEEDVRHGGYSVESVLSPDRQRVAFVSESALEPHEWWVVDADLSAPRQISRAALPGLTGMAFGEVRVIEWTSLHGDTLRGALVYPAEYQEGRRYPLIVRVYGGSDLSNWLNRFGVTNSPVDNAQLYATRGYALLFADSKLRQGTPMADLLASVIPGVNRAIEMGIADPERLGVTGHSYGGYSTLALIAQTPRFKAAVMSAGMGNLISSYGQLSKNGTNYLLPWAEQGQGRMGGTPWEFRSRYIENSPIAYLDRVRTPLLIVHGEEDRAVQPFLTAEVFVGLRRLGQTVTYALYEKEEHWPGTWSYPNQVDVVNRTIAWFDRYLKGESAHPPQ